MSREGDVLENGLLCHVMKVDVPELDLPQRESDGRSLDGVFDLGPGVQQIEHVLHVYEGLLDHTIVRTKVIERRVQLHDVCAVQDEVSHRQDALSDPIGT